MKKILIILFLFIPLTNMAHSKSLIKQPNVSGQFYTADSKELSSQIEQFLSEAKQVPYQDPVEIIIAPHAGYVYSGKTAAYSFKSVSRHAYKTIVVLAPSHYVGFEGVSIWEEGAFQTPLGTLEVDREFTKELIASNSSFYFLPQAFEREHALEVELPFLQKTFKDFKIVPVIMGQPSFELLNDFAGALKKIIGERKDVLIVVSSDLSHYHDDAFARKMDQHTLEAIQHLKVEEFWKENRARTMEMCGYVPVTAAMLYAKQKGLNRVEILHYSNSGDSSGDYSRVVGYSAAVIFKDSKVTQAVSHRYEKKTGSAAPLTSSQKKRLIEIAKETIVEYVNKGKIKGFNEFDPRLQEEEGAFVTIHNRGNLRGCIGNILGKGPLYRLVRDMAIAAASEDHRFKPVSPEELKDIDVEVSVLSKPWRIQSVDEIELGKHGVIVSRGPFNRGLFLPQVADETGWSKEEFLSELCSQKAGLPRDAWKDPQTTIEIFTADVFNEKDIQ